MVHVSMMQAYLIFVMNAVNAVRVKYLECKKIPEERENYWFGLRSASNGIHESNKLN